MNEENKELEETQEEVTEEQMPPEEDQLNAQEVTFGDIEPTNDENGDPQKMDFLLDVPLDISVEIGKAQISIGDLLKLSQGSVVELDKLTNQPVEIFVNKKLMAEGEVVVVNEKFGIRLITIVSPGDRVKGLT